MLLFSARMYESTCTGECTILRQCKVEVFVCSLACMKVQRAVVVFLTSVWVCILASHLKFYVKVFSCYRQAILYGDRSCCSCPHNVVLQGLNE